jgi:DNA-binding NarL/FixJ family response regulator
LAKVSRLESQTNGARLAFALSAIPQTVGLPRPLGRCSSIAELRARFETLTAREQEVMYLVVAGRLNKQIAAELGISEMTAKIHRAQVFRKMQAANLPDLVRMADKFGIANTRLSALKPKW